MGEVITPLHLNRPYNIAYFGQVHDLDMEAVAHLLALYGITTDKAKTWCTWAYTYVEIDLLAHPTSMHIQLLCLAQDHTHERIDTDSS